MRYILAIVFGAVLGVLGTVGAHAQISNPGGVSVEQVQALMPQPASTIPANEQVGGAVGAATEYMRSDAKIPRITRAATVVTDASGNWSVTWATPLLVTPAVIPLPVNPGTQPIVCNVSTSTTTGATGSCWQARTLPAVIGLLTVLLNYSVFTTPPTGTQVQLVALPPTQ